MSMIRILSVVLASACVAAPAIAEDSSAFHAFSQMPSALSAMPEAQLASIQGGTPVTNTQNCGSAASGTGLLAGVGVNALNCSNVGVVAVVPVCAGVGVVGAGSAACQQPTTVVLTQVVQGMFDKK